LAGTGIGLAYGLSVSDAGQAGRMFAASLAYLPGALVAVCVAVLGIGVLPRAAAAVAWALLGYVAVVTLLGDSLDLPGWARSASPLYHTPQAPLDDVTAVPLLVMTVVAVAAVAAGLAGLSRRDMETD
jgi:ABC-2 type transport system permease protein